MKVFSKIFVAIVSAAAMIVVAAIFAMIFFITKESIRAIREVGFGLFSPNWYPVWSEAEFGIRTMLLNSLLLSTWTSFIVFFIGLTIASYLHRFASRMEKEVILRVFEFISGIPSVVLGFFGVVVLAPLFLKFEIWTPLNFLNASIVLSVLTLPLMVSLSYQSLEQVPREVLEGAISLGASESKLIPLELKYAAPGILNAALTVFNRIFGETMIVLMVSGGANMLPRSFFSPVRPLTVTLGSEINEVAVGSLHYSALFFIGSLLLAASLGLNLVSNRLMRQLERWVKG
ncbi:PstC family ABC transporter permease [Pseudothermotoga sp.]|nr:ABC transporter permease subunit [Pseudothermotoga sp.]MDW8139293.1 ABC transporter permease subunit [Pseudothermotoga sp.]